MATPAPLQPMSALPAERLRTKTRVAIAGLGSIGLAVARRLVRGDVPTAQLVAVATRDQVRGRAALDALDCDASIVGLDCSGAHARELEDAAPYLEQNPTDRGTVTACAQSTRGRGEPLRPATAHE